MNPTNDQLLQEIIDLLPVRIFWKDKELNYLGCNKAFAQDAGKTSPAELIGKSDYDMGWKDQAELYRADDFKVLQSGISKLDYEEPQTTPDGQEIWLNTNKVPLRDANGEIYGVLGTYIDVTDRKKSVLDTQTRAEELENMNKLMLGRELKMTELKEEIASLREQLAAAKK